MCKMNTKIKICITLNIVYLLFSGAELSDTLKKSVHVDEYNE